MRHRALCLALTECRLPRVNRLPDPHHAIAQILRHRVREIAHHLFVDVRPEFYKWQRTIKPHIQRFVVRIVKALHERICRRCFFVRANRPSPERTAIRKNIKLIKQHSTIPLWFRFIVDVRSLPRIDRVTPLLCILQSVARNRPRILAVLPVKIRVMPVPLPS